jgi:DNA-directed RNA polymerase subunit K/omega
MRIKGFARALVIAMGAERNLNIENGCGDVLVVALFEGTYVRNATKNS